MQSADLQPPTDLPPAVAATCASHPERPGSPCGRCGTFSCSACLATGLCPSCQQLVGVRPPSADQTRGFGRRAGARLIDSGVGMVVGVAAGVVAGLALAVAQQLGHLDPGWPQRVQGGLLSNLLIGGLASFSARVVGTSICGASLGKLVLGMRVVRKDGTRAGVLAVAKRELAYVADAFFFGAVAYGVMQETPFQQRVGDKWGDTVVVASSAVSAPVAASSARLVVGLGAHLAVELTGLVLGYVVLAMR